MFKKFSDKIKESGSRELIQGATTSFILKIVGLGLAQLFAFVVAIFFGANVLGALQLSISLITIFTILSVVGLDTGLLRFTAENHLVDDKKAITSNYLSSLFIILPLSCLITFVVYINIDLIAVQLFEKPVLAPFFRVASLGIIPFSFIRLNTQVLRGFKKIKAYVFINFVGRHLLTLIIIGLIYLFFSREDTIVIKAYIGGLYCLALFSFFLVFSQIQFGNYNFGLDRYKKLLSVSIPLMLASSLMFIKGWIDILMIGYFMENSDVGIYNIALKIAGLLSIILTAVNVIAAPQIAEAYRSNNKNELQKTIQRASKLIFITSLPIFLIILSTPSVLLGIFGTEFLKAKLALIILTIGYLVNTLAGPVGNILQMTDEQVASQNLTFITALIGVILNYLLIPQLGINGAAISTAVGIIFWNISCVFYCKFKCNLKTYYNPITDFRKWMKNLK